MGQQNGLKISQVRTIRRFMKQDDTCTHILIEVTRLKAAQKLCRNGLIWEAQIFNCKPYTPELRPMQCYKCWGWGHMAKHCKATARCGHCSATAHKGGEEQCPSNNGRVPKAARPAREGMRHSIGDVQWREGSGTQQRRTTYLGPKRLWQRATQWKPGLHSEPPLHSELPLLPRLPGVSRNGQQSAIRGVEQTAPNRQGGGQPKSHRRERLMAAH